MSFSLLSTKLNKPQLPGLAKIAFLQSENEQAYTLLEESKTHGQRYALMDWKYKYYLLLARIYGNEGLYDLALGCINESKTYYYINPIPGGYIHEAWFEGLTIKKQPDFTTKLRGHIIDQAALFGVLRTINDLGVELISVNRIEGEG